MTGRSAHLILREIREELQRSMMALLLSMAIAVIQFANQAPPEVYDNINYVQNVLIFTRATGGVGLLNSGGFEGNALHNLATRHKGSAGSIGISIQDGQNIQAYNNLAFNNSRNIVCSSCDPSNYANNQNPGVVNPNMVFDSDVSTGTIEAKLDKIRSQIVQAFLPTPD